jgi:GntR family transcriptional regulator
MIADISGMLANPADMGRRTAGKFMSFAYVPAERAVAQALGVPLDQMLPVRVRSVDGEPFSYLTTYAPQSISLTFAQQEPASRPLFDLIERAWVKIEHARQRVSARFAAPDVAAALSVRTGTPLIELTRAVLRSIRPWDRAPACAVPAGPLRFRNRPRPLARAG